MKVGTLYSNGKRYRVVDLPGFAGSRLYKLPFIMRILLENVLRAAGDDAPACAAAIFAWLEHGTSESEIPFLPRRVLMHDTTCGPALVDIAGMRSSLAEAGFDPAILRPVLPVDVSTDHSVGVDVFGTPDAMRVNMERELNRNAERYRLMKWATQALPGVRIYPPGTGIMHTLNLERLATVVDVSTRDDELWAVPDSLIGTDSHTPMVNGIGVLGWGVGGIEAESVMFGMPMMIRIPEIVGVRLVGSLREGVLATDLALSVTERLRRFDLGDRFVEFFGPGVSSLSAGDRAVVANMAPEFGGNSGYFPIDSQTLSYLRATGRSEAHLRLVEDYARQQGLWFDPGATLRFTQTLEIDLNAIGPSLAGPSRPHDRLDAGATIAALAPALSQRTRLDVHGVPSDGAVAIAAITSCTNTSNARLVIAAGLLARKARSFGLTPPAWVKTSLAPGSPAAATYLARCGLLDDFEALGFAIVGYGCTTCIGNSGPLLPVIEQAMTERGIVPVAVLSGNRNFPGRVHPQLTAGFLASPPLVVAFALAGDVNRDILVDPIGETAEGRNIYLRDLWPNAAEIDAALVSANDPNDYAASYDAALNSPEWNALDAPASALFPWDETSTYIRRPPFSGFNQGIRLGRFSAHPLIVLGDDITTDHISPAGAVSPSSIAGSYLLERGSAANDLNVFAARRGNWEAMIRGLFTNKTVINLLRDGLPPGWTVVPGSAPMPLMQAAEWYAETQTSTVILAGERYGMGSSRDWAAKGVSLLGVRAVLALSFERIHRANLIGMGVLPLLLPAKYCPSTLGLMAEDTIEIDALNITPRGAVPVIIRRHAGGFESLTAMAAVETRLEIEILTHGGIIPLILRQASETGLRDAAAIGTIEQAGTKPAASGSSLG